MQADLPPFQGRGRRSRLNDALLGRILSPISIRWIRAAPSSMSASLQASSTPVGPAPTIATAASRGLRFFRSLTRARRRLTSLRSRKPQACSRTPGIPKSFNSVPVASTRSPHATQWPETVVSFFKSRLIPLTRSCSQQMPRLLSTGDRRVPLPSSAVHHSAVHEKRLEQEPVTGSINTTGRSGVHARPGH